MTAHPGAYCSPPGATDVTKADTAMVCSIAKPGDRARWRRNGPAPARTPRRRKQPASSLPKVDAGITPTEEAPVPTPAAEPTPVDGRYTSRPPMPNEWGGHPRPGGAHCVHFDGPLVRAVEAMGSARRIDMGGGEPLADTLLNLADDVRAQKLHPAVLPGRVRAVQARLPNDSDAHRAVGRILAEVDHPMTPAPVLPDSTPAPLAQLAGELNRIPICRKDPDREINKIADLARRHAAGQLDGRGLETELGRINRHEMWSDTGSIQINDLIRQTKTDLMNLRRQRRP